MREALKSLIQRAALYPAERLASRLLASDRPFADRDYTGFVIIGAGRSGTSLLREKLNSHRGVACLPELYNADRTPMQRWHSQTQMAAIAAARDAEPARFLTETVWRPYARSIRAVGVKILYLHWERHRSALEKSGLLDGARFIHLRRGNGFARYLSEQRAFRSGTFHTRKDQRGQLPQHAPIAIDCAHMLAEIESVERQADAIGESLSDWPVLNIAYEEIARNPAATDPALCDFLDVERQSLASSLAPTGGAPLDRQVSNLAEVRAALASRGWAGMAE